MKRRIIILICAVCMILALVITLYPLISNVAGEKYRSMVETRYDKAVEKLNTMELIAEKEEAVLYNRTLQPAAFFCPSLMNTLLISSLRKSITGTATFSIFS